MNINFAKFGHSIKIYQWVHSIMACCVRIFWEPSKTLESNDVIIMTSKQARSQDLKKGGGLFWKSEKTTNNLDRIFIVLESESHGLSEFGRFILKIETEISAKIGNSNAFSAQTKLRRTFRPTSETQTLFQPKNRSSPKKKRSSPKLRRIFRPKSEIQTLFQPKNSWTPKKRSSPKLRRIFRPTSEI